MASHGRVGQAVLRWSVWALCAASAAGQSGSLTTSAETAITLTPDEATFRVVVSTRVTEPLTAALALLNDTGITADHLLSIESRPGAADMRLETAFLFSAPYSRLKEITAKLDGAGKQARASEAEVAYAIAVGASSAASERARRDALPGLFAEARARAERLASTTQVTLGRLLSVSDQGYVGGLVFAGAIGGGPFGAPVSPIGSEIRLTVRIAAVWEALAQ